MTIKTYRLIAIVLIILVGVMWMVLPGPPAAKTSGETTAVTPTSLPTKPASDSNLAPISDQDVSVLLNNLAQGTVVTAPRLGGHLAYWFGWYAFFPNTLVYAP